MIIILVGGFILTVWANMVFYEYRVIKKSIQLSGISLIGHKFNKERM